jgi:hypothetical protein
MLRTIAIHVDRSGPFSPGETFMEAQTTVDGISSSVKLGQFSVAIKYNKDGTCNYKGQVYTKKEMDELMPQIEEEVKAKCLELAKENLRILQKIEI